MQKTQYQYNAKVVKVYDGDTIHLEVDLGFGLKMLQARIRLARIDAKEISGVERPDGLLARDWLVNRIIDKDVIFQSIKDRTEKYGRYLAEIWIETDGEYVNVNDEMVAAGFASHW